MSKLAIVTIHNGTQEELKKTLSSIDNQVKNPDLSIVVSKKKINNFYFRKKYRKFIIGKDSSLYNAMNLGIQESKNYHITFLNSGDYFYSKYSVGTIKKYIGNYPSICLNFITILKNKKKYYKIKSLFFNKKNFLSHPSFVTPGSRKKIFFKENFKVISDGIWMRKCVSIFGVKKINKVTTTHVLGGISSNPSFISITDSIKLSLYMGIKELIKYFLIFLIRNKNIYYMLIYLRKYTKL